MVDYDIMLHLSDFINTEVYKREVGDTLEEGIFIPFFPNGIYRTKNGKISISLKAIEKRANAFNQSHYITISRSRKNYNELIKMGYESPIIGNMSLPKYNFKSFKKKEKPDVDAALDIDE